MKKVLTSLMVTLLFAGYAYGTSTVSSWSTVQLVTEINAALADPVVDSLTASMVGTNDVIIITQTNVLGAPGVSLVTITDSRTGSTANEPREASLAINSSGLYGLYVSNGIAQFTDAIVCGSNGTFGGTLTVTTEIVGPIPSTNVNKTAINLLNTATNDLAARVGTEETATVAASAATNDLAIRMGTEETATTAASAATNVLNTSITALNAATNALDASKIIAATAISAVDLGSGTNVTAANVTDVVTGVNITNDVLVSGGTTNRMVFYPFGGGYILKSSVALEL